MPGYNTSSIDVGLGLRIGQYRPFGQTNERQYRYRQA
jgi:hypothetical protein